MILRSPPPKRKAPPSNDQIVQRPSTDLVAFTQNHHNANESTSPGMLCTYQCRQMVKSEVLEDLGVKEKEVGDLQLRVKSLEEDNNNKDLQTIKLEGRIQQMEQELAAANAREKIVQEQFSKELKEFQECLQTRMKQSSALEMKLQHEMKLRAEAESVAIVSNDKITMLEEKIKKSSDIAEREIACLNSEILRLQKDSDLAVLRLRAEIERETCRANSSEQEAEHLKKQYNELKSQLSEVVETRFATHYIVLKRLVDVKQALKNMVISDIWVVWRQSQTDRANNVRRLILDEDWWAQIDYLLSFTEPIYTLIRRCDIDKPILGDIYDCIDIMVEQVRDIIIEKEQDPSEIFYKQIYDIIKKRWDKMTTPLQLLAYALNPKYYHADMLALPNRTAPNKDVEVVEGYKKAFKKMFTDPRVAAEIRDEFGTFASSDGTYADVDAMADKNEMDPIKWWNFHGAMTTHLQKLAIKLLSQCVNKKTELEQELSNIKAAAQGSSVHENNTITKHLQDELRHYEAEVAEARKLKTFHVNAELLREKLLEEKQRADRAEAAIECLPELQLKIIDLENQLKSWRSMIGDLPDIESPDDVPRKISDLQKEAVGNMAKFGEMTILLNELKGALENEKHERLQANKQAASAREEVEEAMSNIVRLERKIALLSKERDGLKAIISSYDEEEAVGLKRQKVGDGSALEKSKTMRIQELEASLARSVSNIKQLEQDLIEQGESLKSQRHKSEFLAQEVDDALRRIKALEREGDRLRCEIATYESKLGHGDFSHATTKVLHMVNTLGTHNQEKDTKESLQLELQRLQAKLKAVDDRKENLEDGRCRNALTSEEASQLKAQIATLEKREERYKKVFAEKISVFRLACCSLFGYKIQMDEQQSPSGIPVTLFTLQSIYALSDDDKLQFEYESGNMNLQMNEYTSQPEISREVDVFLHKFHSIPAFTANLTVELFNRSTMT